MKRIISFILVAILCLGVLTSCNLIPGNNKVDEPAGPSLEDAASYLHKIYKDKNTVTRADFDVVAQVSLNGVIFPVAWTSDNDAVVIRESTKTGFFTVDLPETNAVEFNYTLTATISNANGEKAEKSYTFTVPVLDNSGITTAPAEGVAYKIFLLQGSFNQRYYALNSTQDNKNKFINTTLEPKDGADFFVEKVDGGYKVYTDIDGVKNYIYVNVTRTENEDGTVKYSKFIGYSAEEGTVLTYNEKMGGTWTANVLDMVWGIGTYGTYTTISVSEGSYFTPEKVGDSQFVMQFITSEFANTLEADKLPDAPSDAEGILNKLYALADGESAAGEFKLTGKITALDSYGNPTIVVEGFEDKPVYCYRLTDDRFVVGATISVTALQMKNYGGTYEFMSCTLDSISLPGSGDAATMSIPEVLAAAEGTEVVVTGTVKSFYYNWDDSYGNCSVYIVDEAGNELLCFRLVTKVEIGDNITVTGVVSAYNGVNQLAQGCSAVINSSGNTGTTPEAPAYGVVDPVVGTAYKFGMVQGNLNKTYYLAGGMAQTYYLATTEDASAAIDVYLEEVAGGGYYLYTLDDAGAKLYINMIVSGTHVNGAYEATASTVYSYDATNKTVIASVTPEGAEAPADYWFGTRNDKSYTTVGPCAVSYAGFFCQFYAEGEGSTDTPVDPETPVVPEGGVYTIPEALAAAVGTNVIVSGQVIEINQVWDSGWNNMSVTIADAEGNELYVYRMGTQVQAGDFITVTGTVGEYNSAKQIAQGATAEITGHEDLVVDASCKTLSFADVANRTTFTTEQQVWVANGVTLTNNKAESTQNVADYSAPARFYAKTEVVVECAGMTKITFNLNSGKPASGLTDSIADMEGITVEANGNDITIIFDSAVDSFTFSLVAQIRVDSIDVYTA